MKIFIILIALLAVSWPVISWAAVDSDKDGLTDEQEARYGSDPQNIDTDADGYKDGLEVQNGYSPIKNNKAELPKNDTDKDGLLDWQENWFGTDPQKADTDDDGVADYEEVLRGLDPLGSVTTTKKYMREIVVNLTSQKTFYYVDGVKFFDFLVSTGNPATPTPPGKFAVQDLIPVKRYIGPGYDLPNVKWNIKFKDGFYLHTAYWHNYFGTRTSSHGCVNMKEADAKKLYDIVEPGIPVTVIGETPKNKYVKIKS